MIFVAPGITLLQMSLDYWI